MTTSIDIWNRALGRISEDPIVSFDDGVKASDLGRDNWEALRDAVLRDVAPPCATRRVSLVKSEDAPDWGYDYKFALPADYLRLLEPQDDDKDLKFEVESGYILCDSAGPLPIKYVWRNTNPSTYDASLVEALVTRICAEIAWPLRNVKSLADSFMNIYRGKVDEAKAKQSQERSDTLETDDDFSWVVSRY